MNKKYVAYASGFVSGLIDGMGEDVLPEIEQIILFGSAARGEATKKSDIDIFINVPSENKMARAGMAIAVQAVTEAFYVTTEFRKNWKQRGIENEIKCIVGNLDEWEDLKPSIISDGIILYGKYTGVVKGRSFVVVSWEKVSPETKRVLLSKKLYGYNMNGKRYAGAVEGTQTTKLGSNCIMVPLESSKGILAVFTELGVETRRFHMSSVA